MITDVLPTVSFDEPIVFLLCISPSVLFQSDPKCKPIAFQTHHKPTLQYSDDFSDFSLAMPDILN